MADESLSCANNLSFNGSVADYSFPIGAERAMTDHNKEAIAAMEQLQAVEVQVLQQARG